MVLGFVDSVGLLEVDIVMFIVLMFYVNVWGIFFVVVWFGIKFVLLGVFCILEMIVFLIEEEKVILVVVVFIVWLNFL